MVTADISGQFSGGFHVVAPREERRRLRPPRPDEESLSPPLGWQLHEMFNISLSHSSPVFLRTQSCHQPAGERDEGWGAPQLRTRGCLSAI